MINANAEAFAERFGRYDEVESILYYPHPFTEGGLILVCRDDTGEFLALAADVYNHAPPSLSRHCLRRRELFQLSLPGLFAPPLQVNERPHLPYWLKHKGAVLFGADLRDEVQPSTDPRILLAGHVEGCMDYLRRYGVLTSLMRGKQGQLVAMLAQEMRYLMGTALLIHGVWEVSLETLPARFEELYPGTEPLQIWQHFRAQQAQWAETAAGAIDAVWSFERFLRALREYTS
jgi:hypothetical protein